MSTNDPMITVAAEKPSNFTAVMVMVDSKGLSFVNRAFIADSTASTLGFEELCVLVDGNAIDSLQCCGSRLNRIILTSQVAPTVLP